MYSIGKQDVIVVSITMRGNPLTNSKATFSRGRAFASNRTVYANAGKYFINWSGKKRQVVRERNCFVFMDWASEFAGRVNKCVTP